jgi:hypothetical protein
MASGIYSGESKKNGTPRRGVWRNNSKMAGFARAERSDSGITGHDALLNRLQFSPIEQAGAIVSSDAAEGKQENWAINSRL